MGLIYALSLDGATHRYVGLTTRALAARLAHHKKDARCGSTLPVHFWIRKHVEEDIQAVILAESDNLAELRQLEQTWIATLRENKFELLNLTDGGEGNHGWTPSLKNLENMRKAAKTRKPRVWTEEERLAQADRVRKRNTGSKHSAETIKKLSDAARNRPPISEERLQALQDGARRRNNSGWNHTEESKALMRAAKVGKVSPRKGTKVSEESRERMRVAAQLRAAKKREKKLNPP